MQESGGNAESAVTRALPHLDRVPGEMWLVAYSELHTSRRIRCVFDYLTRELVYCHLAAKMCDPPQFN